MNNNNIQTKVQEQQQESYHGSVMNEGEYYFPSTEQYCEFQENSYVSTYNPNLLYFVQLCYYVPFFYFVPCTYAYQPSFFYEKKDEDTEYEEQDDNMSITSSEQEEGEDFFDTLGYEDEDLYVLEYEDEDLYEDEDEDEVEKVIEAEEAILAEEAIEAEETQELVLESFEIKDDTSVTDSLLENVEDNSFQLIDPDSVLSKEDSFRMIDSDSIVWIRNLVKDKKLLYGPLSDPRIYINERSKQLFGLIYYICHGLTKLPQEAIPPNFILCFDSEEEVFYFDYYFDNKRKIKHQGPVNEHNPERTRKYVKENLIDPYFKEIVDTIKSLDDERENCEYSDPKYIKQLIDSRAEAYELLLVHKLIQFDKRININSISLDDFKQQVWDSFNENMDNIDPFLKIILIAMARLCDLQQEKYSLDQLLCK